jgi:hypothetical protein
MTVGWDGILLNNNGGAGYSATLSMSNGTSRTEIYTIDTSLGTHSETHYWQSLNNNVDVGFYDPVEATIDFIFGQSFFIDAQLNASASSGSAQADGSTNLARINADNSAYWGGISSVTYNGVAVDYSLSSLSGTDWRQSMAPNSPASVPEPNGVALVGLGILALMWTRKSKCALNRSSGSPKCA